MLGASPCRAWFIAAQNLTSITPNLRTHQPFREPLRQQVTRICNIEWQACPINSDGCNDFYSTEIPNLKIILSERSRKRRGKP